jgi:serine/threonine-protein kinase
MGIVYLARDLKLDRLVAVKTLPPQLAGDATLRERFLREARTAAALSHPSIVPIHRADEMGGQVFFVMGYVDGESMAQRIRARGAMSPREVIAQLRDVALAARLRPLAGRGASRHQGGKHPHRRGYGRAHVTDFGIARLAEASPLTQTGQVLGTVYYLSPEQVAGERVDGRSDLYALGVVGYLALSGRFRSDAEAGVRGARGARHAASAAARVGQHCRARDARRDHRPLPRQGPGNRYQSGAELAAALSAIEHDVAAAPAAVVTPTRSLLSDTEAQAIWARAAELQAHHGGAAAARAVAMARNAARDQAVTSGYNVPDVRAAALEAGIDERYVEHRVGRTRSRGQCPHRATAVVPCATRPRPAWAGSPGGRRRSITRLLSKEKCPNATSTCWPTSFAITPTMWARTPP